MVNLLDVFELVIDSCNNGAFAKPKFVEEWDEAVGHMLAKGGHKLYTLLEKGVKKRSEKIALVTKEFTP